MVNVEKLIPLIPDLDTLCMVFGIGLALIGAVGPKKFFGFEMDWTPATSGFVAIVGVAFVIFSFPQLRFWQSNTVTVDRAVIAKLESNNQTGIEAVTSARSGNSYPWCSDRAGIALGVLNDSAALLKKIAAQK
jgi:hypothetical protein